LLLKANFDPSSHDCILCIVEECGGSPFPPNLQEQSHTPSSLRWRSFHILRHVANCGKDGQHPGDPSRGVEELADTKLRRPSTAKLDACFCNVLAGCFDDTGLGSLLSANKASGWTFWIRRRVYAHCLGMCGETWRRCMDSMLTIVRSYVRWRSLLAPGTRRHIWASTGTRGMSQ
jgi:hypothetical protein